MTWITFHDPGSGISLRYPSDYLVEPARQEKIAMQGGASFDAEVIALREPGGGERPFIQITRSRNSMILQYVAADNPLEPISINGDAWQKFKWEGMGDPFGYIMKKDDWFIAVSFIGWDEQYAMQNVMHFVR